MQSDQEQQTTEVRSTNAREGNTNVHRETVKHQGSVESRVVLVRIVWFIIGFIIVMLGLRIVLLMLGANQGAPVVDFIYAVSGAFAWPFDGIFGTPTYGKSVFDVSSVVGIVIYALVGWGIQKLLTLTSANRDVR